MVLITPFKMEVDGVTIKYRDENIRLLAVERREFPFKKSGWKQADRKAGDFIVSILFEEKRYIETVDRRGCVGVAAIVKIEQMIARLVNRPKTGELTRFESDATNSFYYSIRLFLMSEGNNRGENNGSTTRGKIIRKMRSVQTAFCKKGANGRAIIRRPEIQRLHVTRSARDF